MPSALLNGLLAVDATGLGILAATVVTLVLAMAVTAIVHARYASIERDLVEHAGPRERFVHPVLNRIVDDARRSAASGEANTQAIIEDHFQSSLRSLLLGERFVRSATGLVIILGLLGTFYGLTLAIGRLVHLVSADPSATADVTQAITGGLTQALSGMAVAFSNSLFGIGSAVILTVVGVFANVADRRNALMLRVETQVDHLLAGGELPGREAERPPGADAKLPRVARTMSDFGEAVARLEGSVERFEAALQTFAAGTRDFREFNAHLKDNIQRLSLTFADFGEALRTQIASLPSAGSRPKGS
jgi:hypothetical protein